VHSRIIHHGQLWLASKARLPSVTPASLYGRGVFTTLAVYAGRPFLWPEHWARLAAHAQRVGVDLSDYDEAKVGRQLLRLIEANEVHDGRARVMLLSTEEAGGVWKLETDGTRKTELLIITGDARAPREDGLALTVSPYRINTHSPLTGIKSINYLERILSWEEARARDFDESVVLNERGEIVSATIANIFWVTHGTLHTPALATGALAGTTRARVMQLAEELSIPLVEGVNELAQLSDADEIFLTSAGLGVTIVTTFDFHRYTVPVGSVALRLHESFRQLTLQASHEEQGGRMTE
jgi:branched-subunit amino acid aminotransferase/4-amino-4-deoxychorismate lyase